MRVVVLEHEDNDDELVCRDISEAMESVEECLAAQTHKPVSKQRALTVRFARMSKAEYDALPETDRC